MSLIVITVLLAIGLIISMAANMGFIGAKAHSTKSQGSSSEAPRSDRRDDDGAARAGKLEGELDKKRKELEELKKAQVDLKDELKAAKKKLHDQRENDKAGDDLVKARAEVERQASIQLDATRQELSNALATVQNLKNQMDVRGKKRAEAPKPVAAASDEKPEEKREAAPPVQRVIRELSEQEKEKMQRLEQQSSADKRKAIEIAAELRNVKIRIEREKREARRVYEEGKLARDKFRAVELRLNRTLLESDLFKRAISELEKKTGTKAEKVTLSSDELAQSDSTMREKHAAEDKASDDARAKLEASEVVLMEGQEGEAATATGPVTPAPATTSEAPASNAPTA